MKVAVLFRGPVRPSALEVVNKYHALMNQFKNTGWEIHTYLATWRSYKQNRANHLAALDLFDNTMIQTEPTHNQVLRATEIFKLPESPRPITNIFNMYYQSKTALDWICSADTYDFIVHTRTDITVGIEPYLNDWFDPDRYVTLHTHPERWSPVRDRWTNDQFSVAPSYLMQQAWDYGTLANLGRIMESVDIPERILQTMIDEKGIPFKEAPHTVWELDPNRF